VNREPVPQARAVLAHEYFRIISGLMVLGALPLVLFPDLAVRALFSAEFLPAAPCLFLFVLADCLLVGGTVYLTTLRAQDDLAWSFWIGLGSNVTLAAAAWLLIPRWGLAGAAGAFVIARALSIGIAVVRLRAVSRTALPGSTMRALLYLVSCVALLGSVVSVSMRDSTPGLALRIALLAACLGGAVTMLDADERRWLRDSAARWLGRLRRR